MSTQKIIIHSGHVKNCGAMRAVNNGTWDSPWYIKGEPFRGDKRGGRRSNHYQWQPFICNSVNCTAKGIVEVGWLEKLIFIGSRMATQQAKSLDQCYNKTVNT